MRRLLSKRVLLGLAGAVLIVATFAYFLPTIADYRDVWQVVKELSRGSGSPRCSRSPALNVLTFAPPWLVLLPGLRFWPDADDDAGDHCALDRRPGRSGGRESRASTAMLRRWGFAPGAVARSVTLVSLWNQLANLAYPILALFLLTMTGEETAVLATAAFVGVAILGVVVGALVLVLYSNRMAERDRRRGGARGELGPWLAFAVTRSAWGGRSFERFRDRRRRRPPAPLAPAHARHASPAA